MRRRTVPVAAALLGAGLLLAIALVFLQPGVTQAADPREFTLADGSCPHEVLFQGKAVNPDGSTTWSYRVTNLGGSGCGTSHWMLETCQTAPSVYDAFVEAEPNGGLSAKTGDPTTGIVGVKWNDTLNSATDPPGMKFTLTLNEDFEIDDNVPLAVKVGAGVIKGDIEGPTCAKPATPPPTHTPTPTDTPTPLDANPPPPVGGIAADRGPGALPLESRGSSGLSAAVLVGIAAAGAVALGGGAAWYAGRRLPR